MSKEYIADKATLDNVNSIVSALNNRWPDARAGKVDNIQAVLNTPNGDTLAAWLKSISDNANAANSNAANAYNKANDANNNAANAANLASQANSNAWNAYQEAINAKNAANNIANGGVPVLGRPIQMTSTSARNGAEFSGNGKGKLFISAFSTGVADVTIDERYIGSTMPTDGGIMIEFLTSFRAVTQSGNNNTVYFTALFY